MDNELLKKIDDSLASINERLNSLAVIKTEAKMGDMVPNAEMAEAGMLTGITNMKVWDIPVGEAVVGGVAAVFATEIIDGVLYKQGPIVRGLVKAAGAGAVMKWGQGVLGSTGAKAVALLMAFDAVRDILPLDNYAKQVANKVTGVVTTKGLGDNSYPDKPAGYPMDEIKNKRVIATDYYARLRG